MISVYINAGEAENKALVPVESTFIDNYSFTESIFSLYTKGHLYIKDAFGRFSPYIKIGTEFLISFPTISSTTHSMKVASFRKVPSPQNTLLSNQVEVNLINSWFFSKKPYSKVCEGNISAIISSEIDNEGFFENYNIEKSSDTPRMRYMLNKSLPEYITQIIRYGFKKTTSGLKSPLMAYTEFNSSFIVSSLYTLSQNDSHILVVPWGNIKEAGLQIPKEFESYDVIRMLSYTLNSGKTKIPSNDFLKISEDILIEGNVGTVTETFSNYLNRAFVNEDYPSSVEYSPWYKVPEDKTSEFLRDKEIDLARSSGIECICPDEVPLRLGHTVEVVLPNIYNMTTCNRFQVYEITFMKNLDNRTTTLRMFPIGG